MSDPQDVAQAGDPLAALPDPGIDGRRAARPATLKAVAASQEARSLQAWLATLVEEHEAWAGLRMRKRKGEPRNNFERALGAFLHDLLAARRAPPQHGLIYHSLNSTKLSEGPLTYDAFTTAVDAMKERDLIEHWPGGFDHIAKWGTASRFRATPTLLLLVEGCGIDLADLEAHFTAPPPDPVVLRAKSIWLGSSKIRGELLEVPDCPEVVAVADRVRQIDQLLSVHEIVGGRHAGFFRSFALGDQEGFAWNKGGRLYSAGHHCYQQMPKEARLQMRLDGEPVVEVDVKASFLTILHGLTGQPLDMGEDAYAFAGRTRDVAKGWLTATFGSGKAIGRWPREMAKEYLADHGIPMKDAFPVTAVRASMEERFPILLDLPTLGLDWADLMFTESEAMIGAVELLLEKGVPALPIHDSVLVPASAEMSASEIIKDMYMLHALIEPRLTINTPPR